jgi:hypothetical protein
VPAEKPIPFDFIVNGVLLKTSLEKYLAAADISLVMHQGHRPRSSMLLANSRR